MRVYSVHHRTCDGRVAASGQEVFAVPPKPPPADTVGIGPERVPQNDGDPAKTVPGMGRDVVTAPAAS
jgi:hypothetical protein